MGELVYVMCAVTSIACAVLLFRSWRRSKTTLLFSSMLCFAGLAVSNALLVIDMMVVPDQDLSVPRAVTALVALLPLLVGLVWSSPR